jgi:hypothetical protein|tara:strand:- start:256 stop:384 length:129 start_codon:yes stop_codon:yes gene_type:complete
MNKQKFMHYAFEVVMAAFGVSVAGLVIYSVFIAVGTAIQRGI